MCAVLTSKSFKREHLIYALNRPEQVPLLIISSGTDKLSLIKHVNCVLNPGNYVGLKLKKFGIYGGKLRVGVHSLPDGTIKSIATGM